MKPKTPYIRRAALVEWLTRGEGLTAYAVRLMLEDGTIPRATIGSCKRAHYHVPTVAAALHIADPLSPTHQPKPTPC